MSKPDARNHNHGRQARRRWRELFDNLLPVIVACLVVILVVLSVLSMVVKRNADNASRAAAKARAAATTAKKAIVRGKLTAENGCQRVQLLRDDQNVTAWGVYILLDQPPPKAEQLAGLFEKVDPATRALLLALLASSENARPLVARVRDAQRYLPPTSCGMASQNPRYRFPLPVPFSQVVRCYDPVKHDRIKDGTCPR